MTTHYPLCDACETVSHCSKNGCIPLVPLQASPAASVAPSHPAPAPVAPAFAAMQPVWLHELQELQSFAPASHGVATVPPGAIVLPALPTDQPAYFRPGIDCTVLVIGGNGNEDTYTKRHACPDGWAPAWWNPAYWSLTQPRPVAPRCPGQIVDLLSRRLRDERLRRPGAGARMTTAPTPLAPCDAPDTTRRYPRSLADAFPDCRAACIERPARTHAIDRATNTAALVALVLLVLLITLENL